MGDAPQLIGDLGIVALQAIQTKKSTVAVSFGAGDGHRASVFTLIIEYLLAQMFSEALSCQPQVKGVIMERDCQMLCLHSCAKIQQTILYP